MHGYHQPIENDTAHQVKQNYHACLDLRHFLSQRGLSRAEDAEGLLGESDIETLHRLEAMAKEEADQNDEDSYIYLGREIRFSDAFQLLHVKSNKFLKVLLDNAADAEGNRVPIALTNDGSASCFRFRLELCLVVRVRCVGWRACM
jgi:hypothetical protein